MLTFLAAVTSATEIAKEQGVCMYVIQESNDGVFWSFSPISPEYGSVNSITISQNGDAARIHEMKP